MAMIQLLSFVTNI